MTKKMKSFYDAITIENEKRRREALPKMVNNETTAQVEPNLYNCDKSVNSNFI